MTLDPSLAAQADAALQRSERVLTLADLEPEKPTLRLRDLCRLTGFSKGKFLADIERGTLIVTPIVTGRTKRFIVAKSEAARYLSAIGYLAA